MVRMGSKVSWRVILYPDCAVRTTEIIGCIAKVRKEGYPRLVMLFRIFSLAVILSLAACSPKKPEPLAGIVLVISDGTSTELLTATRVYAKGVDGKLALDDFPHTAFVRTFSRNGVVTDSSAGATAMARGVKVDNSVVGQETAESTTFPESIVDIAKSAGWSVGVISDDAVQGATPCSFIVENRTRGDYPAISSKIIDALGKRADIVLGGGSKWFLGPDGFSKTDEKNTAEKTQAKLRDSKAAFFTNWDEFKPFAESGGDGRPVLGTFAPSEFSYYIDGERSLRLVDMTQAAVKFLEAKKKPFFLMVEAGLPDKACHANNAKRAMGEVLELDATLDWLRKNLPANTLILSTTDHNTGGLILNGYLPRKMKGDAIVGINPGTNASVLTFASGPGGDPQANIDASGNAKPTSDPDYKQPALVKSGSAFHTGGDVWFIGAGPGSEKVSGFLQNTDVFRIMAEAIRGEKTK